VHGAINMLGLAKRTGAKTISYFDDLLGNSPAQ
jgi:hypothetical protein